MKKFCAILLISILLIGGMKSHLSRDFFTNNEIKELTSLYGEKILICTSDGFKFVKIADLAKETEKAHGKKQDCRLCSAVCHHNAFDIAGNSYAIALNTSRLKVFQHKQREISYSVLFSNASPRAPPLLS